MRSYSAAVDHYVQRGIDDLLVNFLYREELSQYCAGSMFMCIALSSASGKGFSWMTFAVRGASCFVRLWRVAFVCEPVFCFLLAGLTLTYLISNPSKSSTADQSIFRFFSATGGSVWGAFSSATLLFRAMIAKMGGSRWRRWCWVGAQVLSV
jgi:hypothetical protein